MDTSELRPELGDPEAFVLVLNDVFTNEECQALIQLSEEHKFLPALVDPTGTGNYVLVKGTRDTARVMVDDSVWATELFRRVKLHLPQELHRYKLSCVNERLRFLRYDVGQRFRPHYDGSYVRPDGSEMSFLTIQLYLNGQLEGGETILYGESGPQYSLRPAPGKVLVFAHDILHEGAPVLKGRKYIIRSDIMYKRPNSV